LNRIYNSIKNASSEQHNFFDQAQSLWTQEEESVKAMEEHYAAIKGMTGTTVHYSPGTTYSLGTTLFTTPDFGKKNGT
jgi:hypothetical protein